MPMLQNSIACCVGIHAVKVGNRFAALQPIAQGLQAEFGTTGVNAGKGLKKFGVSSPS